MHALIVLLTHDMVDFCTLTCSYHFNHLTTMASGVRAGSEHDGRRARGGGARRARGRGAAAGRQRQGQAGARAARSIPWASLIHHFFDSITQNT